MKNLKWALLGCMILLAGMTALGLPAAASTSGTTTLTGTVSLIIYDTQVSGITSHSATISWLTNGNATSQVFYDVEYHADTSAYAYHSPADNALVLQHGVGLNGLSPSTTYHCRAESTAIIGGIELVAVSPDFTFNPEPQAGGQQAGGGGYVPPGPTATPTPTPTPAPTPTTAPTPTPTPTSAGVLVLWGIIGGIGHGGENQLPGTTATPTPTPEVSPNATPATTQSANPTPTPTPSPGAVAVPWAMIGEIIGGMLFIALFIFLILRWFGRPKPN